jgi:hypothetical protein
MTVTVHALLITGAGAVIVAPYALRYALWTRANRPARLPARVNHAERRTLTQAGALAYAHATGALNAPYVPRQLVSHPAQWSERDWAPLHTAIVAPDYEGLHCDDEADGDAWIDSLRSVGYSVDVLTDDELAELAEREEQRTVNAMFDRFDRMMTNMMPHVDTICAATIERWQADWNRWCDDHPSEAASAELATVHHWIDREHERLSATGEFERLTLAEALLVS